MGNSTGMGHCLWITTAMDVSNEEGSVICGFDAVFDVVDSGADDVIVREELGDAEGVGILPLGFTIAIPGL